MKKVLFSMVLISIASTLFAKDGKVVINCQSKNVTLYVDGKKSINLTKESTPVMIEEGDHIIKVAEPINKQYQKYGEKEVYVSAIGSVNVHIKFEKKLEPTEAYRKILNEKDSIKLQRFNRIKYSIVTDRKLGLMWQDDKSHNSTKRDLTDAKKYCEELKFSIFDDWRLPTYNELLSIVDYDRYDAAIVPLFKNTFSKRYWSSSQDISAPDYTWVIGFEYGKTATANKSKKYYVKCIRDK